EDRRGALLRRPLRRGDRLLRGLRAHEPDELESRRRRVSPRHDVPRAGEHERPRPAGSVERVNLLPESHRSLPRDAVVRESAAPASRMPRGADPSARPGGWASLTTPAAPAFGGLDRPRTEASAGRAYLVCRAGFRRPRHAARAGHRAFHSRVRSRPEMYLGSASYTSQATYSSSALPPTSMRYGPASRYWSPFAGPRPSRRRSAWIAARIASSAGAGAPRGIRIRTSAFGAPRLTTGSHL